MVRSKICVLSKDNLNNAENDIVERYKECSKDMGGYFIIRGSEKVMVAQERMANNFVYVFKKKDEKIPWSVEIRSTPEESPRPRKLLIYLKYQKEFGYVLLAEMDKILNKPIPLVILLNAMGYTNDKKILKCIFS